MGLYEQYPLLANLRVREAFAEHYLSFVAVQAATSGAVVDGVGLDWPREQMNQLAVPFPFLQEMQRAIAAGVGGCVPSRSISRVCVRGDDAPPGRASYAGGL